MFCDHAMSHGFFFQTISDKEKKSKYRLKATEYIERTEKVHEIIAKEKEKGKYNEQIKIQVDSTGHSYEQIFGRFLDSSVTRVTVEDPYIRAHHQIVNFLRFCELCVARCANLRTVELVTSSSEGGEREQQQAKLEELQQSLAQRHVALSWRLSSSLHDREVRLDTGWVIKIGRGLDIYKPPEGKMVLGYFDLNLRKCLETTVDIFFKKDL